MGTVIFSIPQKIFFLLERLALLNEAAFLDKVNRRQILSNERVKKLFAQPAGVLAPDLLAGRGHPALQSGEWRRMMLLRYGLAMHFCKSRKVLETCAGLGWGAFLMAGTAGSVIAVEIDKRALGTARALCGTDSNVAWINASVTALPFQSRSFDLVTAMETVEHFSPGELRCYLRETRRVLRAGGLLIGSSYFPETEAEADAVCRRNPAHRHIYTKTEFGGVLQETGFNRVVIFRNRFFFIAAE